MYDVWGVWKQVLEVSGWVVVGFAAVYALEVGKQWFWRKVVK